MKRETSPFIKVFVVIITMLVVGGVLIYAAYTSAIDKSHMDEYPNGYEPADYSNIIVGCFLLLAFLSLPLREEWKNWKSKKNQQDLNL